MAVQIHRASGQKVHECERVWSTRAWGRVVVLKQRMNAQVPPRAALVKALQSASEESIRVNKMGR